VGVIFDRLGIAFAAFSRVGEYLYQNAKHRELSGRKDVKLMGYPLTVVLGPSCAPAILGAAARDARPREFLSSVELPGRSVRYVPTGFPLDPAAGWLGYVLLPEDADGEQREALERSVSLLQATLDSTADGILAVDRQGQIIQYNRRFAKMWNLSPALLALRDDEEALSGAVAAVEDPDAFLRRVHDLYEKPEERSFDTIRLRDGRIFERYSRPEWLGGHVVGRVWSFRDVTQRIAAETALRESEARFRQLFEDSRQAIYLTSHDGVFEDANPAALRLFGLSREELPALNAGDFYADRPDRAAFQEAIERNGGVLESYPVRLRSRSGTVMDCLLTTTVRRGSGGEVIGYQGIVEDVTERLAATRALAERERLFRTLIEQATDTITVIAADGTITYESPSLLSVLGYDPEDLVGRNIFDFVHDRDRARAMAQMDLLLRRPRLTARLEVDFLHRDGSWRTLEAVARNLLDDETVEGVIINARDVTERKTAEARLLHDAFHDRLTLLPNRALFLDRLDHRLQRAQRGDAAPFAVLFLDLDRFKLVNDSLGHSVGDELLVALARRLRMALRPGDTVARLGGDEFAMLLDGANLDVAQIVADRIHADLRGPVQLTEHELFMTVSVGIVSHQPLYARGEDMLRDADLAMYQAKDRGRARHEVFDEALYLAALARLGLETDFRHALERGEFELFYQPIVHLSDYRLLGFEALIRWWHPARGLLLPGAFLPLAEDTRLVVPMGTWVLNEACRQVATWCRRFGEDGVVPVRLNVSAHQLSRPDFVDRVAEALSSPGVPPSLVHLELTESAMMEHREATVDTLNRLKELGVGLSIDDFGTGYSSLAYLHRFPTDSVKIDRSFVSNIAPGSTDLGLVRSILDLAHGLGMVVVAEGIETEAQADALRQLGCSVGQGFLFGRPLPAAQAVDLLTARA
jgi:diguanylate cyclase (GGDEF)-like protein/PAS domain S-box-containing protein